MKISRNSFRTEFGVIIWDKYFSHLNPEKEEEEIVKPVIIKPEKNVSLEDKIKENDVASNENSVSLPENIQEEQSVSKPAYEEKSAFVFNKKEESAKKSLPVIAPSLKGIVDYYKRRGVVGEEDLAVSITLAAANNISFGVEGFSGSGKTFLVDRLMDLLPEEDVYRVDLSSKMAVFYDAESINNKSIIYIPELQKAMQDKKSPIIEVIKNLTEGKDVKRIVTNGSRDGSEEYTINKGKSVIYTLALENYFKKDEESSRRLMRLQTDSSKEHLEEIHNFKANKRLNLDLDEIYTKNLELSLKNHINFIRKDLKDVRVVDPFAVYMQRAVPKTQKSVGYVDHFYNLVDACVKFHYDSREKFGFNGADFVIANLEDNYNIFNLYFDQFRRTIKDFADRTEDDNERKAALQEIENVFMPDWNEALKHGISNLEASKFYKDSGFKGVANSWKDKNFEDISVFIKTYKLGEMSSLD